MRAAPARVSAALLAPWQGTDSPTPTSTTTSPPGRTRAGRLGVFTAGPMTWGVNGPTAAGFTIGRRYDRACPQLSQGWRVDLQAGGATVWQGELATVQRGNPWQVTCVGWAGKAPELDKDFDPRAVTQQVIRANQRGVWAVQPGSSWPSNLPATAQAPSDVIDCLQKTGDAAGLLWQITPYLPGYALQGFRTPPLVTDLPIASVTVAGVPDVASPPTAVFVAYTVASGTSTATATTYVTATQLRPGVRSVVEGKLDLTSYGVLSLATAQALAQRYLIGAATGVPSQITVPSGGVRWLGDRTASGMPGGAYVQAGRVARYLPGRAVLLRGVTGGAAGSPTIRPSTFVVRECTWDPTTDVLTLSPVGSDDLTLLGRLAEYARAAAAAGG